MSEYKVRLEVDRLLDELPEELTKRLADIFSAGYRYAEFDVWLIGEEDAEGADIELHIRGAEHGRDAVEVCDCRSCLCECFEEQMFGVEGTLGARDEGELRQIANAIAGILRQNYVGGYEGHVEVLRRMDIDVVVYKPSESCGEQ